MEKEQTRFKEIVDAHYSKDRCTAIATSNDGEVGSINSGNIGISFPVFRD